MPETEDQKEEKAFSPSRSSLYLIPTRETGLWGGIAIILLTIVALIVVNSRIGEDFTELLKTKFFLGFKDGIRINLSLKKWINDGLMVIFFFVAGLEIKREIAVGELSTWRKASLPLMAAIGGMLVPGLIFLFFNWDQPHIHAWGVPVATDIAYSLGILALLGSRVPASLKLFLLALAIFDDLGAILIIAFFYGHDVDLYWLGGGILCFISLMAIGLAKVNFLRVYFIPGIIMWVCFLYSGIHPTIAGVLFAMTIPVYPKFKSDTFLRLLKLRTNSLSETQIERENPLTEKAQRDLIENIRVETKRSNPPLIRLENGLSTFSTFVVVPLFVLANAGVVIPDNILEPFRDPLGLGITLGLLLGKTSGIMLFTWGSVKLGLGELPKALSWSNIFGVSMLAAIGFTMSLFITNLAIAEPGAISISKISILTASFTASLLGFLYLRFTLRKPQ